MNPAQKKWTIAGLAAAGVAALTVTVVAVSYNPGNKTLTLQPGDQVAAICPNPLSWVQVSGATGRLSCARPTTTTTTTTVVPTTTTAPVTTTTRPTTTTTGVASGLGVRVNGNHLVQG